MTSSIMRTGAARPILDQDWRKVVTLGLIAGLSQVFIALANMPVALDDRVLIEPILSLGYVSLLWVPLAVGYSVGKEVVLEGVESPSPGAREVLAGALAGLISGAGLSVLVVLIDRYDIRDPLVNWSPALRDLLSFQNSLSFGVVIWLVLGAALGAVGGVALVVPQRVRSTVLSMLVFVFGFAILESVIRDLSEKPRLEWLTEWLYFIRGGLAVKGVIALAVIGAFYALVVRGTITTTKEKLQALDGPSRKRANVSLTGVGVILLLVLPLLVGKITNELLANVGLFVLLALGLNIVVGMAGILDLGYVAFFAVGGYVTAILTSPNSPGISPELPWFVAIGIVVVAAAITGLLIGVPVIRMRGDYLAIVTLGFGEIIRLLFLSDWLSGATGGSQGITRVPGVQIFGLATVRGTDPRAVFYLVMVFCALAIYVSWRLERSRHGRAWMAIREDESVAEAMGINTVNSKLLAFVVGAILASFSGAIFAAKVGAVFPTSFVILVSIVILVVVIVGGIGNIVGVIAGAAVLIGVLGGPSQPGLLAEFSEFKLLVYGALLIWMMLKRPEGLIPNVRRSRELHQEEFLQDAWLRQQVDADEEGNTSHGEAPA